jgi:hypothetical protein
MPRLSGHDCAFGPILDCLLASRTNVGGVGCTNRLVTLILLQIADSVHRSSAQHDRLLSRVDVASANSAIVGSSGLTRALCGSSVDLGNALRVSGNTRNVRDSISRLAHIVAERTSWKFPTILNSSVLLGLTTVSSGNAFRVSRNTGNVRDSISRFARIVAERTSWKVSAVLNSSVLLGLTTVSSGNALRVSGNTGNVRDSISRFAHIVAERTSWKFPTILNSSVLSLVVSSGANHALIVSWTSVRERERKKGQDKSSHDFPPPLQTGKLCNEV